MDLTPNQEAHVSEDSGCLTGSFQNSNIAFESTPNTTPTSSLDLSRKRKASFLAAPSLTNITEVCPKPQFSSTLNESLLLNNLEQCRISPKYYVERDEEEKPVKYVKLNDCKSTTPLTPVKEKQSQSGYYNESPFKEALDILYPNKPVINAKKAATPQKHLVSSVAKRVFSPAKKRLFEPVRVDPMKYFKGNSLVLEKLFENLSDGDLYRVSMVSKSWNGALLCDRKAYARYLGFVERQRVDKENYTITPPDSPPSPVSPPVSPSRQQFHAITKLAKTLSQGQTLTKCPACTRPSVMEKNIGQCQNPVCGYIYCSICLSCSTTGPEDFHDRCQKSQLLIDKPTTRRSSRIGLSDLSNSGVDLEHSCFFPEISHNSRNNDTSGYVSEMDSPVNRVKRNLTRRFSDKGGIVLAENNRRASVTTPVFRKRRSSLVPVISNEIKKEDAVEPPPSPPKVENIACSKQSKKNLKRLLR